MAKRERIINGDFDDLLETIDSLLICDNVVAIGKSNADYTGNGTRCAIRTYEKRSVWRNDFAILTVTLVQDENQIYVSGITSDGNSEKLLDLNSNGEYIFLDSFTNALNEYEAKLSDSKV